MDTENIIKRDALISQIRTFFASQKFQQFHLPVLTRAIPIEQNIYPFTTIWQNNKEKLYLSTSPESGLKQLISSGFKYNCFSISPSFRDLESSGPTHQPEFLMLEWYRLNADYTAIMIDTQNLIIDCFNQFYPNRTNNILTYQNLSFDLTPPWPQISLLQLFQKYADQKNIPADEPTLNQIFLNKIEPHLADFNSPIFITDYPAFMSPLATPKLSTKAGLALSSERFELYFGPLEIANGNTENQNPQIPVTWNNLPPCAGCGLGIDRLAMLLTDQSDIAQVRPFPL